MALLCGKKTRKLALASPIFRLVTNFQTGSMGQPELQGFFLVFGAKK